MNFVEIAYLTKIEKANPNAGGTEMNITVLKKTEEIDGTQRVYISGASIKYAIKEYWKSKGLRLSEVQPKGAEKQITTKCEPENYIDDDLLGYMDTATDKKRVAPVKTSGLISLFPYSGDINRGVRFSPDPAKTDHSLYDVEITTNVMRGNFAIELDRIGAEYIIKDGKRERMDYVKPDMKDKRLKEFFDALFNLWGGGHQTNFLTKLSPEVMVVVFRDDKTLTIADKLKLRIKEDGSGEYSVDIDALKEAIEFHKNGIDKVWIGAFKSFVNNWSEIKRLENDEEIRGKVEVMDMNALKQKLMETKFFG